MQKFYTIFFVIDLEPKYFYMWVNFVDLVFKNFNMDSGLILSDPGVTRTIEKVLLKTCNIMNIVMLYFGIVTYFIFIYI